jgi:hypothetical protein
MIDKEPSELLYVIEPMRPQSNANITTGRGVNG